MEGSVKNVTQLENTINCIVETVFEDFAQTNEHVENQSRYEHCSNLITEQIFEQFKNLYDRKKNEERVKTYFLNKLRSKQDELFASPMFIGTYLSIYHIDDELDKGEGFFCAILEYCEQNNRNDIADVINHCVEVRASLLAHRKVGAYYTPTNQNDMIRDFVKTKAQQTAWGFMKNNPYNLNEIHNEIIQGLSSLATTQDKLDFLTEYETNIGDMLAEHQKECAETECMYQKSYNEAIYYVDVERKNLNKPSNPNSFNNQITSGIGQIFNYGSIGTIITKTQAENEQEYYALSNSINELTTFFKANEEIEFNQRDEMLELLKQLGDEALKPKENRMRPPILKSMIKSISDTVNLVGSAASITGINLTNIHNFFGK